MTPTTPRPDFTDAIVAREGREQPSQAPTNEQIVAECREAYDRLREEVER